MKNIKFSTVIVIVISVIIAFGVYTTLSSSKEQVYVFNDNYSAGTVIDKETMLSPVVTDKIVVSSLEGSGVGYVTADNESEVLGDSLKVDVTRGSFFTLGQTDKFTASPAETRLSENNVGITIEADNIKGVTPFISVGSRVNIFVTLDDEVKGAVTKCYQNIKVIDVQYSEKFNDTSEAPVISAITVELTPELSMKVSNDITIGDVRFGLVKNGKYKEVQLSNYISGNSLVNPKEEKEKQ